MSRKQRLLDTTAEVAADITLSVENESDGKPALYAGTKATLDVTLVNAGPAIGLQTGAMASTLTVLLPRYVSSTEVGAMTIALADWTFSVGADGASLQLSFVGGSGATWTGALTFQIENVVASAQPVAGTVIVNTDDLAGVDPATLTTPLPLLPAPVVGNASLSAVVQASLDNRGGVYVSTAADPLSNTLFLNFKNVGPVDLFSGTGSPGKPVVEVQFEYGSTPGALAPDNDRDSPPLGSAWNIQGDVFSDQTAGWKIAPAGPTDPNPVWRLSPTTVNIPVIGTGAHANVSFAFSNIISLTAVGHTQVTLTFRGFKKDDKTNYDDTVMVLDIVKQVPPPTRGLINFFGAGSPIIAVADANTPIEIPLRWAMFDVARVDLITSFPGIDVYSRVYAKPPNTPKPLDYDEYTVTIPKTSQSSAVFTTLQALDANDAFLNSLQYTVMLRSMTFVDPRDRQEYPIVLLNNQFWMAHNLAYAEANSRVYNDDPSNQSTYGRLYPSDAESVVSPPAGWHLPSVADWKALFALYSDGAQAYATLTAAAPGDYAAVLGGMYAQSGSGSDYTDLTLTGYYRVSDNSTYAGFHGQSTNVSVVGTLPADAAISIRYVKDI